MSLRFAARRVFGCTLAWAAGCADAPVRTSVPEPKDDRATEVATRIIERRPGERMRWGWETAVLGLGLARLAEVDPGGPWADELVAHLSAQGDRPIRRPDDCAPAIGAALLLERGIEDARPAVERVAAYLRDAPRNPLGALDHLDPRSPLGRLYPDSIWVDSLVMYAVTAARVGQALHDDALLSFAHAQPVIFAEHLQDPATGLFRHAYLHQRERTRPEAEVFWLRGNGWVAVALVELLDTMEPGSVEHFTTRVILQRLAAGLQAHRRVDGMWTTVLDDRRSYVETSGTALVAYALAKAARRGWLPEWHRVQARQTLRALESRLRSRPDGPAVAGTSGPTIPSGRLGYVLVPRRVDVPYGVGAYLALAAELRLDRR